MARTTTLVEREEELARLDALVERACAGVGGTVLVEGPPGIGKSSLLLEARRRAKERGAQVFAARGSELEGQSAFGVVCQLFALALTRRPKQHRRVIFTGVAGLAAQALNLEPVEVKDVPTPSELDIHHGLYWLCSNLAECGPVVIAVDDAQWADPPSLRWISYLARRLEDLPVLLVVSSRSSGVGQALSAFAELRTSPNTLTLRPRPLSQEAVADVVHRLYGQEPDEAFARACTEATGGNPFFATVIIRAAIKAGFLPTADQADGVENLVPGEITDAFLARIARRPGPLGLAQGAAVLGDRGELRQAAVLAGLDEHQAATAADELVAAEVLLPTPRLRFTHPLVRRAVYASIPVFERRLAHRRAALLFDSEGHPAEAVAAHLLEAEPMGDPRTVAVLRRAAAAAAATPDTAVTYLRRALAEPPPQAVVGELLGELGSSEARVGDPQAVEHLTGALEAARDVSTRAELAVALSRALAVAGRMEDALQMLCDSLDTEAEMDREVRLSIEGELLTAAQWVQSGRPLIAQRIERVSREVADGQTPAERRVLSFLAQEGFFANQPALRIAQLALRALAGGHLLAEQTAESHLYYCAVDALSYSGELDRAEAALDEAARAARPRGFVLAFALSALSRCVVHRERGAVRDLEAEARVAFEEARVAFDAPSIVGTGIRQVMGAFLAEAMAERGELGGAKALLDGIPFRDLSGAFFFLGSRGRLHLEMGRPEQALEDLLASGRQQLAIGLVSPAVYPWRSPAALALVRMGEAEEARRLATEEVALAEAFGTSRAIGVAVRALALVEPDEQKRIELLRRAENVLVDSGASLELARARTDLGAALRAAKMRTEAREPLRKALDAAHRCGATALEQRCWAELSATGARPRRAPSSGLDALTPAELRVARLATDGLTTREIAEAIFVSRKTVEKHLGQVYSKLGVHTREELQHKAGEPRGAAPGFRSQSSEPARAAQ